MNPATRLMAIKLSDLASRGMTIPQAAEEIGASYIYVHHFAGRNGIVFVGAKRGQKLQPPDERSDAMRSLYLSGKTLEEIGQQFGVTRERIRQIVTKHYGKLAEVGGGCERSRRKKLSAAEKREARYMKTWGCSYKQYRTVLKYASKPTYAFIGQRRNAKSRGIGWELNFWQWWSIWQQSGHWGQRGRGNDGYCMCRLNDKGPYAADNVYIATGIENMQDYWVNRRASSKVQEAAA